MGDTFLLILLLVSQSSSPLPIFVAQLKATHRTAATEQRLVQQSSERGSYPTPPFRLVLAFLSYFRALAVLSHVSGLFRVVLSCTAHSLRMVVLLVQALRYFLHLRMDVHCFVHQIVLLNVSKCLAN